MTMGTTNDTTPPPADVWDECCKAFAWAMKNDPTLAPVSWLHYVHKNNPYRPTTTTHLRHSTDGYPLCWPMDRDDPFTGSFDKADVDCPECLAHLAEERNA